MVFLVKTIPGYELGAPQSGAAQYGTPQCSGIISVTGCTSM